VRAAAGLPLLTGHVAVDVLRERGHVGRASPSSTRRDGRGCCTRRPSCWPPAGYGQLYASTTNPATATGDGVALACAPGRGGDLEFVQFHPTVLYTGPTTGRRPLVTEAVRGEGRGAARPHGSAGSSAVRTRWPTLAPRDVVAAAITRRMAETVRRLRLPRRPRAGRLPDPLPDGVRGRAAPPGSTRCASRSR
jgi:L-aspartate oxidase